MGLVARKKLFSIMALCAMVSLLLLPVVVSIPSLAIGADAPDAVKKDEAKTAEQRAVLATALYQAQTRRAEVQQLTGEPFEALIAQGRE